MVEKMKAARESERLPVSPSEIKGSIVDQSGEVDQVALVWNISVQELCLWVSQKHKQGDKVTLKVTVPWKGEIKCIVRWNQIIPDKAGFLIGLEALDGNESLKELHKRIISRPKAG